MRLRMSAIAVVMLSCGSDCTPARKQSGPRQQQEVNQFGGISGTVVNQRGLPVAGATVTADELGRPFIGMRPWAETDPALAMGLFMYLTNLYLVIKRAC